MISSAVKLKISREMKASREFVCEKCWLFTLRKIWRKNVDGRRENTGKRVQEGTFYVLPWNKAMLLCVANKNCGDDMSSCPSSDWQWQCCVGWLIIQANPIVAVLMLLRWPSQQKKYRRLSFDFSLPQTLNDIAIFFPSKHCCLKS